MLKKLYHRLWEKKDKFFKDGGVVEDETLVARTNLFYSEDKVNNSYDVYYPAKAKGKMPTIFMFHGGGYVWGTKEGTRNFSKLLASNGFLVFNLEYTKCDKLEKKYFPCQIYEFYKFYKHMTEQTEFVNLIDFNNQFLAGNSAGVHIAALIANIQTNHDLKMEYGVQGGPQVKGVILTSPSMGAYEFAGFFLKKPFHEIIFGKLGMRSPLAEYTHNLDVTTESFPPAIMLSVKHDIVVGVHKKMFLKLAEELNLSLHHYELQSGYKLFHSSMVSYAMKYPHCFEKITEFINDAKKNKFVEGVVHEEMCENAEEVVSEI